MMLEQVRRRSLSMSLLHILNDSVFVPVAMAYLTRSPSWQ